MFFSAAKTIKYLYYLVVIAATSLLYTACTTVKNYPANRPFVYSTNINLQGKFSTDEKRELESQLDQQLHDSIRVRRQRKFIFWYTLKNPPVFDSLNVAKSKIYLKALLNSVGYYRDSITADTSLKIEGDQYRTTVNFSVIPGRLFKLDSIWYNLLDSVAYSPDVDTLQNLTQQSMPQRLLRKGEPFSKPLISSELDRLSDVYRNNGYLRFSKEQLIAVWDTVGIDLLRFTVDPIEQASQIEALRQRRENPIADMEVRLRPDPDTVRLTRYYVGTVKIYPDFDSDTAFYAPKTEILTRNQYQFISYKGLFKPRKLLRFIELKRGELYRQSNYLKTQNKFSALSAWRLVTINQLPRPGVDTVDFDIRLVPAKQFTTGVNVDVSKNQGNLPGFEGNLLGLGTSFTLVNRNFGKAANQATTNLRYGVELTSRIDSIQTQQLTFGHTIQFPRLVPRMQWLDPEARENARTFLTFNFGYTDRIDYYQVTSLNTSWAYEFSFGKTLIGLRMPNIEYNTLQRRRRLDSLIKINSSYKYIFNDGLIISGIVNFTIAGGFKNKTNLTRISIEESGLVTGLLFPKSNLYRFLKLDAEFSQNYKINRSAFVWRVFGGVGYGMPLSLKSGSPDSSNYYMPFFRQYYAGGPNSMRAWSIRKLGPGSAIRSFSPDSAADRFGDIRLELNGEYRYYLTQVFGFPLEGALFTDIGNVWFLRKNKDFENGEFSIKRLWKDLGVGMGTGFRIDFGFLKARFDFAWKAKDPSPENVTYQNKWFYKWRFGLGDKNGKQGAQFQLGINYPF